MTALSDLLARNRDWARRVKARDPEFFARLASQQKPRYLWIGCSDSRVPANQIVDLPPGEVFVHRNVANQVIHSDLNCLSVIHFAVQVLRVEHIIVCGHHACAGVGAALRAERHGLVDNWLGHLRDLAGAYSSVLEARRTEAERLGILTEINVASQVVNVSQTTVVRDAWARGQALTVHGWVYRVEDGILHDLGISTAGDIELEALLAGFLGRVESGDT